MLILVTAPIAEPVTLVEIKTRLSIDYDDHDSFINNAITAARTWVERRTGRALLQQTWELREPEFETQIEIPKLPVISISQVSYINDAGTTVVLAGGDYIFIDGGNDSASVIIPSDDWPSDVYDRPDAVRVTFVAGYGSVPEDIKEAIRQYVGQLYELRESSVLTQTRQGIIQVPMSVDALLAPYIVPRL